MIRFHFAFVAWHATHRRRFHTLCSGAMTTGDTLDLNVNGWRRPTKGNRKVSERENYRYYSDFLCVFGRRFLLLSLSLPVPFYGRIQLCRHLIIYDNHNRSVQKESEPWSCFRSLSLIRFVFVFLFNFESIAFIIIIIESYVRWTTLLIQWYCCCRCNLKLHRSTLIILQCSTRNFSETFIKTNSRNAYENNFDYS